MCLPRLLEDKIFELCSVYGDSYFLFCVFDALYAWNFHPEISLEKT